MWENWAKVWNGDYDRAPGVISPKFRVHVSLLDGSPDTAIRGVEGLTAFVKQSRTLFNDLKFTTQVGPFIDGKHVVGRWIATGTYAGGIPGATAPVGTKVTFTGTDILRTEHGKVVEYWLNTDTIALLGQLGVGGK
ncbi:ester cyclase [Streptomyces lunaelactis]|nr:ester cyclase [Streptomyces lunaelactis]NUK20297.1 ester cyclase [Streptomyces lunaelactis]